MDLQKRFWWIFKRVSDGFPTWKVLAPVPQHLCLLLSPVFLPLWIQLWTIIITFKCLGPFWLVPESEKILQLRSLSWTVASPKFSSLRKQNFSTALSAKLKGHTWCSIATRIHYFAGSPWNESYLSTISHRMCKCPEARISTPVWSPCRKGSQWPWCPLLSPCAHHSTPARGGSKSKKYGIFIPFKPIAL